MFQMDLAITPGIIYSEYARPAYIKGEFEAATVQELFLGLGYEERQTAGRTYYAIREDYQGDVKDPTGRIALNTINRVYVDENSLISAPATDMIEGVLEAWAGEQPSVLENAGFAHIGEALWDTLSTAIMPRSAVLDTSRFSEVQRAQFEEQETWGTLHEWEAVGFGFGKDADAEKWYAVSLFYPDPDAAEADAPELVHRMETYETVYQDYPEHPFVDTEIVSTSHVTYEDGSVLTVRYRAPGATIPFGGGPHPVIWFELVAGRDLGFLVPQTQATAPASTPTCRIAFVSKVEGDFEILVMNAVGSDVTCLTCSISYSRHLEPSWSPDGSQIAFVSGRDRADEIYVMDADGSHQTRLTYTLASDQEPDWSPAR